MTKETAMFREARSRSGEGDVVWGGNGGGSSGRQRQTLSQARVQQEAEAKAPGGDATRWGLRRRATQQQTEQEGRDKR
jgi:hypothetical protein